MSREAALKRNKFEFRRQSDGLIYPFARHRGPQGETIYQRSDGPIRVVYDSRFGWSIWSDEGDLLGRAWEILPEDQGDYPPEGIWVSRRGAKAYVYDLVYVGD